MKQVVNQITKWWTKAIKYANEEPLTVLLAGFIVLILIMVFIRSNQHVIRRTEGFDGKKERTFDVKRDSRKIYDGFYVSIYDKLVMNDDKNKYELKLLEGKIESKDKSRILDIGSGTGHHVGVLTKKGYEVTGLDVSDDMNKVAKREYPDSKFVTESALNPRAFQPGSFTHIICMYFTVYYMKDIGAFMKNCYSWLAPGGQMMIHLVNRDKFDPILPAGSPFVMVPPQYYAKERITDTSVKFDDFQYKANFEMEDGSDVAVFKETFTDDAKGSVRKHELTLNMLSESAILGMAKKAGFIILGKQHMGEIGYDYQYLYMLEKPQ